MPKDKPKKPVLKGKNAHRVTFLAVSEKIDAFLSEGYSWQAIYDFFIETEAFSMSYSTFCRYMNGLNKPIKKRVDPSSRMSTAKVIAGSKIPVNSLHVNTTAAKQPVIVAQPKEEDFSDKKPVDPNDVY